MAFGQAVGATGLALHSNARPPQREPCECGTQP